MIEPKDIEIDGKKFTITKFPAVAGREIVANYAFSSLPKIGDYQTNEATMFKIMKFVFIQIPGTHPIALSTPDLINSHTGNWETLAKLEIAALEYNCSFLADGRAYDFLNGLAQKAEQWISKMLINSLVKS